MRAIAIDIDGTLTDMQRRLDWDGVIALRAAEACGIPVILATGNVIPAVKTIQHCIGTTGPLVCENGGTIYWEIPQGAGQPIEIHRKVLHDRQEADRVIAHLKDNGHQPRYISSDPWRESEAALELSSIDEQVVRDAVTTMGLNHLYVVTTGFACHVLHQDIDKMVGINHALDWLNHHDPRFASAHHKEPSNTKAPTHPPSRHRPAPAPALAPRDVIAIGDSMNDHEMLQGCGIGVALSNAPKGLHDVADLTSKAPHGAGVREVLEGLGLDTKGVR